MGKFKTITYQELNEGDKVRIVTQDIIVTEGVVIGFYNEGDKDDFGFDLDNGYIFSHDQWNTHTVKKLSQDIGSTNLMKPIKSNGGSSPYYDIPVPNWLLNILQQRKDEGDDCFIKTEELIEILGSDFDEANILKCLIRINSLKKGVGKEGNDVEYDVNKIIYSANRLKERECRKDG